MKKIKISVKSEWCISCWLCVAITSQFWNFKFIDNPQDPNYMKSHAAKQPETEEEIKLCKEAAEACPVSVINYEEIDLN